MNIERKSLIQKIFRFFVYIFAILGLLFFFVYFAMKFGLLNVKGSMSERNKYFSVGNKITSNRVNDNLTTICKINILNKYAPLTSINIYKTLKYGASDDIINKMIDISSKRFENDLSFLNSIDNCSSSKNDLLNLRMTSYAWADTDEWNLMKEVFTRDQDIIKKAATGARISPRYILSGVIGEQFRFFGNRRESFKSYFEPLKILASLSNTSYGIAGLKPKTVSIIENNLKNKNSLFYLGEDMENIADYIDASKTEEERMNRITDSKNPYYSYLYVGLFMKQIITQWEKSGYDISNNPGVLGTLYNLGFYYSVPNDNPKLGGSNINIGGVNYTFGDIAHEFYYSGELADIFQLDVK